MTEPNRHNPKFQGLKLLGVGLLALSSVSLVTTAQAKPHKTLKYNWKNASLVYFKQNPKFLKKHEQEIIHIAYPKTYSRYRNNRIALHQKEKKLMGQIKSMIAKIHTPVYFQIDRHYKLGKYNFKKHQFKFRHLRHNKEIQAFRSAGVKAMAFEMVISNRIKIPKKIKNIKNGRKREREMEKVSNQNLFQAIKVKPAAAKKLLNNRKNKYGQINRTVDLSLRVKVLGSQYSSRNGSPTFKGKILKATAYAGKNHTHKIQTWTPKRLSKPRMTN